MKAIRQKRGRKKMGKAQARKALSNREYNVRMYQGQARCFLCPKYGGENAGVDGRHIRRSWKKYRKTQYKNIA